MFIEFYIFTSLSEASKTDTTAKVNNVVLFAFSTTRWWDAVEKKLDLNFTYVSLMTRILFASFFSSSSFLSRWRMKIQQQIAPLCNAATSNELGVHFRVSVTVHSNGQSNLHPPPSGTSFVNAQSPPAQENYHTRKIDSSFPRLATKRSLLATINFMLCVAAIFFPIFSSNLIKIYILYSPIKSFKKNNKNVILWKNSMLYV